MVHLSIKSAEEESCLVREMYTNGNGAKYLSSFGCAAVSRVVDPLSIRENRIEGGNESIARREFGVFSLAHTEYSLHRRGTRSVYLFYCVRYEKHFIGVVAEHFSNLCIAVALRFCSNARVKKAGNVLRQITCRRAAEERLLRQDAA